MKMKLMVASLLAGFATVLAATTSGACLFSYDEVECPESLIK